LQDRVEPGWPAVFHAGNRLARDSCAFSQLSLVQACSHPPGTKMRDCERPWLWLPPQRCEAGVLLGCVRRHMMQTVIENVPCLVDELGDIAAVVERDTSFPAEVAYRLIRPTQERRDLFQAETTVDSQEVRGGSTNLT